MEDLKFSGNYLYMICHTCAYYPLPEYITTNLEDAIKTFIAYKGTEHVLQIWFNSTEFSEDFEFNSTYYQLMMDFIDDNSIPREVIREIRKILDPYVENELNQEELEQQRIQQETERKELLELERLAKKYGKSIN